MPRWAEAIRIYYRDIHNLARGGGRPAGGLMQRAHAHGGQEGAGGGSCAAESCGNIDTDWFLTVDWRAACPNRAPS